jgi:aminoglycoside phosphotransferase
VENLSVDAAQRVNIDTRAATAALPDEFERLMWAVTEEFGLPLAYMRVQGANLLQMTVPPRSKRG